MMTDPIADMLTRIRNALMVKKETVEIPGSRLKKEIARILKEEGFIEDYKIEENPVQDKIIIKLKYYKGESVIRGLRRVSKPGRRIYVSKNELPNVLGGLGIAIISTSRGVMTNKEAKKLGLGGEYICDVW
ncbi:small subunit ribosomal protein S8 [Thermosulfidibacter takaii ABI70S6]|uniref:Small ribosomal subunit protein uS8 n=1 Tax=Thermosulfidibacter takaii (strain DSM 17441 / JCM 13301 / NBRC 103674 / ABI70S6) TaxID=1298851 RepID=A0A0S3QV51_THET7|nr:30S ribosomal protein S8 [Thermosulfidibacter takaii]BAT72208.1 small subunit ribosomal protein S8 [Thermosulfidibacter takaii ABI70S6]